MGTAIVILVIGLGAGGGTRRSRRYRQAHALRVSSQEKPHENVAQNAFMHGNTCLMKGKFDGARAAFHQARELEPKHPQVADRIAEVQRQQTAAFSEV